MNKVVEKLYQTIIVSVQAEQGEPFNKPECLLAMVQSVINGGAKGLRIANPENIELVKEYFPEIPVIGITKRLFEKFHAASRCKERGAQNRSLHVVNEDSNTAATQQMPPKETSQTASKPPHPPLEPERHVYITPNLWTAEAVIRAGADIVAMDATMRPRPQGESLAEILSCCRKRFPNACFMADIATEEEAFNAQELGFDLVATTLSGYTTETSWKKETEEPDFELLAALTKSLSIPVLLEGRVWHMEHVREAFEIGAYAVVIGSAITRPHLITSRFVKAIPSLKP